MEKDGEPLNQYGVVVVYVAAKAQAPVGGEIARLDDHESETVGRDLLLPSQVVEPPLLATTDSRDRVAAVEERNRFVVLALAILNNHAVRRIVGVDRQGTGVAILADVAEQPREAVLTQCSLAEDRVAQINDVSLVAGHRSSVRVLPGHLVSDGSALYARSMLYALLANDCQFAIELFVTRAAADNALADTLADEPEWVTLLSVAVLASGDAHVACLN